MTDVTFADPTPRCCQIPNLAGLARTCEIFAASSLVIPDARVIKNPAFSKISTGAEQWLPIEELGEKQLLAWIRRVKRQGYALVGIEQTNNSVCLTQVRFALLAALIYRRQMLSTPTNVLVTDILTWPIDPAPFAWLCANYCVRMLAGEVPTTMRPRAGTRELWPSTSGDQRNGLLLPDPAARRPALS